MVGHRRLLGRLTVPQHQSLVLEKLMLQAIFGGGALVRVHFEHEFEEAAELHVFWAEFV